jgi:hypothetical protein
VITNVDCAGDAPDEYEAGGDNGAHAQDNAPPLVRHMRVNVTPVTRDLSGQLGLILGGAAAVRGRRGLRRGGVRRARDPGASSESSGDDFVAPNVGGYRGGGGTGSRGGMESSGPRGRRRMLFVCNSCR